MFTWVEAPPEDFQLPENSKKIKEDGDSGWKQASNWCEDAL